MNSSLKPQNVCGTVFVPSMHNVHCTLPSDFFYSNSFKIYLFPSDKFCLVKIMANHGLLMAMSTFGCVYRKEAIAWGNCSTLYLPPN